MCKAFIDNGLFDPVAKKYGSDLFGKSIVFCVSQKHAGRVTNILNKLAFERWPEHYGESNFAVQVTSLVASAQQMTINFSNNMLNGKVKIPEGYDSSKTRVAVTVGMMTTGYDCQDILNLALMRPVFSPTDFIQIKGRGTRKFTFEYTDEYGEKHKATKDHFKFFDFFANCEYFEEKFDYDEVLQLPIKQKGTGGEGPVGVDIDEVLAEYAAGFFKFHDEKYGTSIDVSRLASYRFGQAIGTTEEEIVQKMAEFHGT